MDVVVAWLKTALVEAHHNKAVKDAAVVILQVGWNPRSLTHTLDKACRAFFHSYF
jgi:hypothetical protein